MERETGVEPATSTLARSHSTTELLPHTEYRFHFPALMVRMSMGLKSRLRVMA